MFHYKATRTERQSKHRFRDASLEPPLTKVNKTTKPIPAGHVVHRFSLPSHVNTPGANKFEGENQHLVVGLRQEKGTDHAQISSKVSPQSTQEFVAYFNERDGRGFLKESQDSVMQQMVL